jgi:hypothetical protein
MSNSLREEGIANAPIKSRRRKPSTKKRANVGHVTIETFRIMREIHRSGMHRSVLVAIDAIIGAAYNHPDIDVRLGLIAIFDKLDVGFDPLDVSGLDSATDYLRCAVKAYSKVREVNAAKHAAMMKELGL